MKKIIPFLIISINSFSMDINGYYEIPVGDTLVVSEINIKFDAELILDGVLICDFIKFENGSNSVINGNMYTSTLFVNNGTITGDGYISSFLFFGWGRTFCYDYTWFIPFNSVAHCGNLPIELISFDASMIDCDVQLNWSTLTEINNNYFDIQYSGDGVNFDNIGRVEGFGNSNTQLDYSFIHYANSGINYYRLKQVDYDGKYSYSNIISIDICDNKIIFPNPINRGNILKCNGDIKIYNELGYLVSESKRIDLKAGIYIVVINGRIEKLIVY